MFFKPQNSSNLFLVHVSLIELISITHIPYVLISQYPNKVEMFGGNTSSRDVFVAMDGQESSQTYFRIKKKFCDSRTRKNLETNRHYQ